MDTKVEQLLHLQKTHSLRVEAIPSDTNASFIKVRFFSGTQRWEIYIDNEYGYFNPDQQLLCCYLVLSALEEYNEADDYLKWCTANGLNASETYWLDYYRTLGKSYQEIEKVVGEIDSLIDPLEYQLGSGSFHALLTYEAS